MSEVKKGIFAALGVALGAGAVITGTMYRNSVDLGLTASPQPSLVGLVASAGKNQDIPESAYFDQLADLLKSEYVDDIADQMKLADGAVRGMVTRLDDPHCLYFDAKNLAAYKDALSGKFQGIGAAFILRYASAADQPGAVRLPRLIVAEVAKGGAADKAGMRPGDVITSIDGHWVINSDEIEAFRKLVSDKDTPSETLLKARREMREKSKNGLMPMRAFEKLFLGKSGSLKVAWKRGATLSEASLQKGEIQVDTFRFGSGADHKLRALIGGSSPVELDLRGQSLGDRAALMACLEVVAKSGTYGYLMRERKNETVELKVTKGGSISGPIRILVDEGTRGVPEVFARALKSKGLATVTGKTAGDPVLIELHEFPNGTGYTLAVAEYSEVKK